jgi:2-oxoglutarate dehydrogenase E2 component (dihydrolipoamide succinyltransferase)
LKQEGDTVSVGDSIGEIGAGNGAVQAAPSTAPVPAAATSVAADPAEAPTPPQAPGQVAAVGAQGAGQPIAAPAGGEVKSSPAARRLADESGVNISDVSGTGRGGVVSKPDVIAAINAQPAASQGAASSPAAPGAAAAPTPAPAAAPKASTPASNGERETREKMTTRRKRIAENLLQSQHATAHLTTFNEIDMTAISALRERLKERTEKEHGVKLSFMPFFAKAACMALKSQPTVNAQIDGDTIVYKHYVNLGIAVASDAGLVVPNIKDADRKSILEIGREIGVVAKRARDGKLSMDDLTGGTFTITNGGVFGSLVSTPIINYPQVGILGLHKIQDRPVAIDGKVEIRPMMYVALSYDHRIIDGQQAVLFLVRVKELMEDPASMLVV